MSAAASELPAQKRDGRRARRDRSRDLAVDAFLDLVGEGVARPTAQQVAERSGVSLRSIFRIFDDVETLYSEAASRQLARSRHLYVEVPDSGTLTERVEEVIAALDRLYTEIAPVRRVGLRLAAESPALQAQLSRGRAWLAGELQRVLARELDARPDRDDLLAAAELLLSFEAWDQLTSVQGLEDQARRSLLARTLLAVLRSAD